MATRSQWLSSAVGSFAIATASTAAAATATPIKHIVVIFQENVSFDHYFGTYPVAKNPRDEPAFTPGPNTPSVNGPWLGLWCLRQSTHRALAE
jgi:phospholipase C